MNCTGKRCIMQFDKVDPATCKCVSYCPEATPPISDDELKDIREVIATLISWAAGEGLGYTEATRLLNKLYSGCEEDVRQ